MSQPPFPYNRIFDFESFSIVNPTTQQPGVQIEGELDSVKRTLDGIMSRLSEIQRDDGYIRDSALDQSTLVPQVYNQILPLLIPIFDTKAEVQHTHPISNVVGLQEALINAKIQDYNNFKIYSAGDMVTADNRFFKFNTTIGAAGYGPITHPSAWTEQSARPDLSGYALTTAVTAGLAGKANTTHTHLIADTTGLQTALDGKSATTHLHTGVYAPITHSHLIADTTGLQAALDGKSATTHLHTGVYAPVAHGHVIGDTTGLQTALDGKSDTTHLHTGVYAPVSHSHVIGDTTGLQTALDGKANLSGATFTGRIGVGVAPSTTAALKVDAGGIMFNDGTTLTTAPTGGGGGGTFTGGVVTSPIIFDGTSGQYIGKGSFDTTRGGNYGISLVCSIGYEFNWQAGWLRTTEQDYVTPRPLYLDSNAGTTLRVWDASTNTGLEISHGGITFPDNTTQGSAGVNKTGGTFTGKVDFTSTDGAAGLNIGVGGTDTSATTAGDMWIATGGSALNYRDGLGTWRILASRNLSNTFTVPQIVSAPAGTTSAALRVTQLGTGHALVVEDSNNPDTTPFVIDNNGRVGVGVAPSTTAAIKVDAGGIMFNDGTTLTTAPVGGGGAVWGGITGTLASQNDLNTALSGKANLSGAAFTGKVSGTSVSGAAGVNIGIGGSTAATSSGDMWIASGDANLNYRDGQNVWQVVALRGAINTFSTNQIISASTSASLLRITQTGTGHALVVEDNINPDSSSFVITSSGSLGVGVNPSTFVPSAKFEVQGTSLFSNTINIASDIVLTNQVVQNHTNAFSTYTQEIKVNIGGVDRWIPIR
jgi:hypothetical protein